MQAKFNLERTASLLEDLIQEKPNQFNIGQLRALHKRVAAWRKEQIKVNQEQYYQRIFVDTPTNNTISKYVSLIMYHIINNE